MSWRTMAVIAVALLAVYARPGAAQEPPASQRGTVSQNIHTTTVHITYDRPSSRGRTLFGEEGAVVTYDALWTPGANRATILELSRPARIFGQELPAAKYSVWTIPSAGEWTFILNRTWDTHHAIYPGEADDALRVSVAPESGPHMETLAVYFPVVEAYRAIMHVHWGSTVLAVPIDVNR